MSASDPTDPPELPKLPPIRESAEHVVPLPPAEEASAEDWTAAPAERAPGSAEQAPTAATRSEARRRRPRPKPPEQAKRAAPREVEQAEPDPATGGRRGGRGSRTEDGRRYSTAGHGLIVALLGLLFGALLLAPGMHKSAFNGQPGTKREVSLALTGGLTHVSHALLLDRPRGLVQDAMGRDNADDIDVAIVVPPTTVTPNPTVKPKPTGPVVKQPPAKAKFTPQRKLRLWIAGDSLVITPGYSIVRAAGGSPVIESVGGIDGHIATGLTRPDVFNWFNELTTQVKALKPNVVVLNFGANDNHGYMTGLPDGVSIGAFASPEWVKEYRRRVGAVMDTVNRAGGVVVWIGLPIARSPTETQEFDKINAVVLQEAKLRPGKVIFIDTYNMFAGDDGGFAEYLQNDTGDTVKVRAGDGVHFETAGGDLIAREVLKQLNQRFDLTSWRKQRAQ